MGKIIIAKDGKKMERISRWIKLRTNYNPSKRNSLWDYVTDDNGSHPYQESFDVRTKQLLYFKHAGRTFALEQFFCLGSMWVSSPPILYEDDNGKLGVIGTVDMDSNMFHPLYGEWDECCEYVRLYREV